jgi:hypothetical protein
VAYIFREPPRGQTLLSRVMFADAHEEDIVVDPCDLSLRPAPSIDASRASIHRPSVDWGVGSSPRPSARVAAKVAFRTVQKRARATAVTRRGISCCQPASRVHAGFFRPRRQYLRDRR